MQVNIEKLPVNMIKYIIAYIFVCVKGDVNEKSNQYL